MECVAGSLDLFNLKSRIELLQFSGHSRRNDAGITQHEQDRNFKRMR